MPNYENKSWQHDRSVPFEIKSFDEEQGIFEGYAAVFSLVDDGDDIIEPGAFTKTLAEWGPLGKSRIKILALHNDKWLPIGKPLELREEPYGLYVKGKISDTSMGKDVKILLKDMVLTELSIGYDAMKYDYDKAGKRHLKEVRLYEFSPVIWAMNQAATVTGYKAAANNKTLPLAEKELPWDESAAHKRVKAWAEAKGTMDWSQYGQAFLCLNNQAPEELDSKRFMFMIGDIVDGELKAIPRAIVSAACLIQEAKADPADPELPKAMDEIKNTIAQYYAKLDMTSPFEKGGNCVYEIAKKLYSFDAILTMRDSEDMRWKMHWALSEAIDAAVKEESLENAEKIKLIDKYLTQYHKAMLALFAKSLDAVEDESPIMALMAKMEGIAKMETKAGKVISAANMAKIKAAMDALTELLGKVDGGKGDDPADEEQKKSLEKLLFSFKTMETKMVAKPGGLIQSI